MSSVIAFIGGGNMAASLIGGLVAAGRPPDQIRVAELDTARRSWLTGHFGVVACEAVAEAVDGADAVVLAVKPQQARQALSGLQLAPGTVFITIAAGLRIDTLQRWLGEQLHYIRCMPNTPALLGAGITGLYTPERTPANARDLAGAILAAAGSCVWTASEAQLDAVTALSGSGPAYYFLLTEVLREAGERLGLSAETAATLACQTFIGAARMAEGDTDVGSLRRNVTSKGGTTEAAIQHLETAGIRPMFNDALSAAAQRAREIGDQLSQEA